MKLKIFESFSEKVKRRNLNSFEDSKFTQKDMDYLRNPYINSNEYKVKFIKKNQSKNEENINKRFENSSNTFFLEKSFMNDNSLLFSNVFATFIVEKSTCQIISICKSFITNIEYKKNNFKCILSEACNLKYLNERKFLIVISKYQHDLIELFKKLAKIYKNETCNLKKIIMGKKKNGKHSSILNDNFKIPLNFMIPSKISIYRNFHMFRRSIGNKHYNNPCLKSDFNNNDKSNENTRKKITLNLNINNDFNVSSDTCNFLSSNLPKIRYNNLPPKMHQYYNENLEDIFQNKYNNLHKSSPKKINNEFIIKESSKTSTINLLSKKRKELPLIFDLPYKYQSITPNLAIKLFIRKMKKPQTSFSNKDYFTSINNQYNSIQDSSSIPEKLDFADYSTKINDFNKQTFNDSFEFGHLKNNYNNNNNNQKLTKFYCIICKYNNDVNQGNGDKIKNKNSFLVNTHEFSNNYDDYYESENNFQINENFKNDYRNNFSKQNNINVINNETSYDFERKNIDFSINSDLTLNENKNQYNLNPERNKKIIKSNCNTKSSIFQIKRLFIKNSECIYKLCKKIIEDNCNFKLKI